MIFAGFDTYEYPGDENMALLRAKTNLSFCGFYLAPAPCHEDAGWMTKRAELVSQGWGLVPIFVGRQLDEQLAGGGEVIDPSTPAMQGNLDGMLAADCMAKAGFDTGSYVYLDVENGPPLTATMRTYIQSWASAVRRRQFCPGIYVSHLLADAVSNNVPGARIWTVKVASTAEHNVEGTTFPTYDPHAGGYQYAYVWQHDQSAVLDVDGLKLKVDLNVAILRDPSRA